MFTFDLLINKLLITMRMGCYGNCCIVLRLTFAMIGILSGICIFIVFMFHYHNYNAAIWGFISGLRYQWHAMDVNYSLISGLFSLCVFHINYLYFKSKIDEWYDERSLRNLIVLALIVILCSLCAFSTYLTLAITQRQG